jgi:hypothetical protein
MATVPKFRIDVDIHNLLRQCSPGPVNTLEPTGAMLPEPVFARFPKKLLDPGPDTPPEKRAWTLPQVYRKMRGWLFPHVRSRVLPGDFHPITAGSHATASSPLLAISASSFKEAPRGCFSPRSH